MLPADGPDARSTPTVTDEMVKAAIARVAGEWQIGGGVTGMMAIYRDGTIVEQDGYDSPREAGRDLPAIRMRAALEDALAAAPAGDSPSRASEQEIRRLTHDVLTRAMDRAEAILTAVQGHPVAVAVGELVAELHGDWRLFDALGGFDGADVPAGVSSSDEPEGVGVERIARGLAEHFSGDAGDWRSWRVEADVARRAMGLRPAPVGDASDEPEGEDDRVRVAAEALLVARFGKHKGAGLATCTDDLRAELLRDAAAVLGAVPTPVGDAEPVAWLVTDLVGGGDPWVTMSRGAYPRSAEYVTEPLYRHPVPPQDAGDVGELRNEITGLEQERREIDALLDKYGALPADQFGDPIPLVDRIDYLATYIGPPDAPTPGLVDRVLPDEGERRIEIERRVSGRLGSSMQRASFYYGVLREAAAAAPSTPEPGQEGC